jgi:peptidoglycan L-alanyl-D-glutamate endopeptidase CwlK
MFTFGERSTKNLKTCHPDLQKLFNEVIKHKDCAVIEGFRNEERQDELYHAGRSKKWWPESEHNSKPSLAVDVIPYPIDWENEKRFIEFCGFVKGVASQMNINIISGGLDWKTFIDYPHFQLEF